MSQRGQRDREALIAAFDACLEGMICIMAGKAPGLTELWQRYSRTDGNFFSVISVQLDTEGRYQLHARVRTVADEPALFFNAADEQALVSRVEERIEEQGWEVKPYPVSDRSGFGRLIVPPLSL